MFQDPDDEALHEVNAAGLQDDATDGSELQIESDGSFELANDDESLVVTPAVKAAVYRLHVNTGHRSSTRLARALLLCGAPKEAVLAARRLKCAVCQERR